MASLKSLYQRLFLKKVPVEYHSILTKYNSYYAHLNEANQEKFLKRIAEFIDDVSFNAERGFDIELKMKVIIASAFTQITFGLKNYTLNTYTKIFIAPQSYTYKGMNKLLAGDVNTVNKKISLSWPAVIKGFKIEDDALNIAIHEFGHCLTIENFSLPYLGEFFNSRDWKQWSILAIEKLRTIRAGENEVIRSYGGTDIMELFAVSLENFFERPQHFKDRVPHLYEGLKVLLKQDPLKKSNPIVL